MGDVVFSSLVTLSLVLLCVISWFAYRVSRDHRHATGLWFWGSVMLAAASALLALRPLTPQWLGLSVFFVNSFLATGIGFHVSGLIRLDEDDRLWWALWIPSVAVALAGAWAVSFPFGRFVLAFMVGVIMLLWIVRVFVWVLSRRWGERAQGMFLVLGFYGFSAAATIVFGSRSLWMPLLAPPGGPASSVGLSSGALLLLDLSLLSIGFGELLLIYDLASIRYRHEVDSKLRLMVDLEEYRKLQKTLVERERDVSLARMVATVNHSLNSPLAALSSANTMLGQVVNDQLPGIVFSLRTLTPRDWWRVARIARAMQPMTIDRRRRRKTAFSQWLKAHELPDLPDALVDVGIDLREDLLEELLLSSNPTAVLQLLSLWADSLTARSVVDLATRKASKLLLSLREWFETGYDSESASVPVSAILSTRVEVLRNEHPLLNITAGLEALNAVNPPSRPLERVFQAVLENAALAAGDEGTIAVRSFDRADGVTIEIEDNGAGVAPNKQEFLFEPFVGASVESQSLGVSLYFCRLFLGEWGGSIVYRREAGLTRFTIELPS
jgi:signal transduction histidine kinase